MSKLVILLIALSSVAYVSATFNTINAGDQPLAASISQLIVETVSRKIVAIARFFDLKLRLVRFLVSLWTTENLVLLRGLIEEAVRFGSSILNFLPQNVEDPSYWWIQPLSQFININLGDSGLIGVILGQPQGSIGAASEIVESVDSNNGTNTTELVATTNATSVDLTETESPKNPEENEINLSDRLSEANATENAVLEASSTTNYTIVFPEPTAQNTTVALPTAAVETVTAEGTQVINVVTQISIENSTRSAVASTESSTRAVTQAVTQASTQSPPLVQAASSKIIVQAVSPSAVISTTTQATTQTQKSDVKEDFENLMKRYEERIMTLDKLIMAGKEQLVNSV